MKIEYKIVENEKEMELCYQVRNTVFTLEQKFDEEIDKDEYDKQAIHIMAIYNGKCIGTARMFKKDDYYKVGRVCIISAYRNKNIGKGLMDNLALHSNIKLRLSSQLHAKEFYEKCGYQAISDVYLEEGVKHILMEKQCI